MHTVHYAVYIIFLLTDTTYNGSLDTCQLYSLMLTHFYKLIIANCNLSCIIVNCSEYNAYYTLFSVYCIMYNSNYTLHYILCIYYTYIDISQVLVLYILSNGYAC